MRNTILYFFLCVCLTSCFVPELNEWETYSVKQGGDSFSPRSLYWKDKDNCVSLWQLTESCTYEFDDIDQCDWNKLTGYSFHFGSNHKNSVMAAWRWDIAGYWWIAPYWHEDSQTQWVDVSCSGYREVDFTFQAISVRPGEIVEVAFIIEDGSDYVFMEITNTSTNESLTWSKTFPTNIRKVREINPYFGGTKKAPHQMTILRKRTW